MGEYRRLALLVTIMIGICVIVGAPALGVIYDAAPARERARLVNRGKPGPADGSACASRSAGSNRGRAAVWRSFGDPGSASPPARAGGRPDRRGTACPPGRRLNSVSDARAWLASTSRSHR